MTREQFVEVIMTDQPDTPAYFTYDAILNSRERPTLDDALARELRPLALDELDRDGRRVARSCSTRANRASSSAPTSAGALNIGLGGSFATWCGTLLDPERQVVLVAEPGRELEAATRLGRIGFDSVAGYLVGGMQQLDDAPELVERIERITAGSVAAQLDDPEPPVLVDVRTAGEWDAGHIDHAVSLPLSQLAARLCELPQDRALVVYCASGYRSAIATSLLQRHGRARVANLVGGLAAWSLQLGCRRSADDLVRVAAAARREPLDVRRRA